MQLDELQSELDQEELLLRHHFGNQVDEFWNSQVGSYLRERARECYNAAIHELKFVDPEDSKKIRHLQNEVAKCHMFVDWLSEAILDGLKAHDLLTPEDDQ